jgi:N-carbamoylputrescine amidase
MEVRDQLTKWLDELTGKQREEDEDQLRISLIQMRCQDEARDENLGKACSYIDKAMVSKPHLIVLPELFNTEYWSCVKDIKYFDYAEPDDGPSITKISEKAKEYGVYIIATIYEIERQGLYYDSACVIGPDGNLIGKQRKIHPALVRSLEKVYFRGGDQFRIFDIFDWKVGIVLCYDNLFPEAVRAVSVNGAELVVAPYASPYVPFWDALFTIRAVENGVYYAGCNKVGPEMSGQWVSYGKSAIVAPTGEFLCQASEEKEEIIHAKLYKTLVNGMRVAFPVYRDRRPEAYTDLCKPHDGPSEPK